MSNKASLQYIKSLVLAVKCDMPGMKIDFVVTEAACEPCLQIALTTRDINTGEDERQLCRKWLLEYDMTDTEIVRTCYKAVEALILHELQESFKYADEALYSPHTPVHELLAMRENKNYNEDCRD